MPNMSYCRFENTVNDFRDCLNDLEEQESLEHLSDREKTQAKRLFDLAQLYIEIYSDIKRIEGGEDD